MQSTKSSREFLTLVCPILTGQLKHLSKTAPHIQWSALQYPYENSILQQLPQSLSTTWFSVDTLLRSYSDRRFAPAAFVPITAPRAFLKLAAKLEDSVSYLEPSWLLS
jgi:hypothetical protein